MIDDPKWRPNRRLPPALFITAQFTHHFSALEAFNLVACCNFYISVSFFIFLIMMTTAPCFFHFSLVSRGRDFGAKRHLTYRFKFLPFFTYLGYGNLGQVIQQSFSLPPPQVVVGKIYIYVFIYIFSYDVLFFIITPYSQYKISPALYNFYFIPQPS